MLNILKFPVLGVYTFESLLKRSLIKSDAKGNHPLSCSAYSTI